MKLLSGATRHVFLIGDYAIKVPRLTDWKLFLHGLLANMQEAEFGNCPCVKNRMFIADVAPVFWRIPLGFMIVMARARPLTDFEWAIFEYESFVNGQDYVIPAENKQSSFGIYDGRLVAVDYG